MSFSNPFNLNFSIDLMESIKNRLESFDPNSAEVILPLPDCPSIPEDESKGAHAFIDEREKLKETSPPLFYSNETFPMVYKEQSRSAARSLFYPSEGNAKLVHKEQSRSAARSLFYPSEGNAKLVHKEQSRSAARSLFYPSEDTAKLGSECFNNGVDQIMDTSRYIPPQKQPLTELKNFDWMENRMDYSRGHVLQNTPDIEQCDQSRSMGLSQFLPFDSTSGYEPSFYPVKHQTTVSAENSFYGRGETENAWMFPYMDPMPILDTIMEKSGFQPMLRKSSSVTGNDRQSISDEEMDPILQNYFKTNTIRKEGNCKYKALPFIKCSHCRKYICFCDNYHPNECVKETLAEKPMTIQEKFSDDEQTLSSKTEYSTPEKYDLKASKYKGNWSLKKKSKKKQTKFVGCRFCLSNGEVAEYCHTHRLKDDEGNIICPILSKYVCPRCGATGAKAHTKQHCPLFQPMTSSKVKNGSVARRNAAGHIVITRV